MKVGRSIVIAFGTVLLIAAAVVVVVASRNRQPSAPTPNVPVAASPAGVRVKAVERKVVTVAGGEAAVVSDAVGHLVSCAESGSAFDVDDTNSYSYNARGELTNAIAVVDSNYRYAYDFDDIGNRKSSAQLGANSVYTAKRDMRVRPL